MLTARQAECHRFIFEHTRHFGDPPSLQQIADGLGLASRVTC